ncbi:hypothetical protein WAI453_008893 [Rhynchosporium graminicola]
MHPLLHLLGVPVTPRSPKKRVEITIPLVNRAEGRHQIESTDMGDIISYGTVPCTRPGCFMYREMLDDGGELARHVAYEQLYTGNYLRVTMSCLLVRCIQNSDGRLLSWPPITTSLPNEDRAVPIKCWSALCYEIDARLR